VGRRLAFVVAGLLMAAGAPARGDDTPWAHATGPSAGPSHAIGGTSAGCLAGGVTLPPSRGLRVMRPERGRFTGHRELVAFLRALGRAAHAAKLGVVPLGDLSQPRGGPAPSGHSSHQTGLDVDIWYQATTRAGKPDEVMMVDARRGRPARAWRARHRRLVQLAASDPRVDRLFVHPLLKRSLCENARGNRAWLRKVRPWWGHDDHFHVRLACPAGDAACVPQAAIPDGDGCAELDEWLSPAAAAKRAEKQKAYQSRVGAVPELPAACADLVP
jgi:penicillin-insensitive murein endopeptidase